MSFQQIYESMFGIASKLVFLYFTIKLFTIYFLYPTISKKVRATIPATKKCIKSNASLLIHSHLI